MGIRASPNNVMQLTKGGWMRMETPRRQVIVNLGEVVRPSQLIASVRRTWGDGRDEDEPPDPTAAVLGRTLPEAIAKEVAAVCRHVFSRPPGTLRLKRKDGPMFEMTASGPAPIVTGDMVTVMPGETRATSRRGCKANDSRIGSCQAENLGSTADADLELSRVTPRGRDRNDPHHSHPFPGVPQYGLGMYCPDADRVLATSRPYGVAARTEHWANPSFQLVATDFRFEEPTSEGAVNCEVETEPSNNAMQLTKGGWMRVEASSSAGSS